MGVLTESSVHLRDEIVAWRQARAGFRQRLESETKARQEAVAGLLAAFAGDLAGVRRAWSGLAVAAPPRPAVRVSVSPPVPPAKSHPKGRKRR